MTLDICLSDILEPEALPSRKYNRAGCTVVAGVCATLHILVTIKKSRVFFDRNSRTSAVAGDDLLLGGAAFVFYEAVYLRRK